MNKSDLKEFKSQFKLVCLKCGSENVVVSFEPGRMYSERTVVPATVSFGCNDCKKNDFYADL